MKRLARLVENYLSAGLSAEQADPEMLWRIRVLNVAGFFLLLFGGHWATHYLARQEWRLGLVILVLVVLALLLLVYLRRTRRLALVAHLLISFLLLGTSLSNWFSGGLAGSNTVAFFIVPLVVNFPMIL